MLTEGVRLKGIEAESNARVTFEDVTDLYSVAHITGDPQASAHALEMVLRSLWMTDEGVLCVPLPETIPSQAHPVIESSINSLRGMMDPMDCVRCRST